MLLRCYADLERVARRPAQFRAEVTQEEVRTQLGYRGDRKVGSKPARTASDSGAGVSSEVAQPIGG